MAYRGAIGTSKVGLTANICSDDNLWIASFQRIEFIVAQLRGKRWLGNRVGAR